MMNTIDDEMQGAISQIVAKRIGEVVAAQAKAEEHSKSINNTLEKKNETLREALIEQQLSHATEFLHQGELLQIERDGRVAAEQLAMELANKPAPEIKFPEQKEVDLLPVSQSIESVKLELQAVKLELETLKNALGQPAPAEWDFKILRDGANNMVRVEAKQKV